MQTHGGHWGCIDDNVEEFIDNHIDSFLDSSGCIDMIDDNGYNIATKKIQDNEILAMLHPIEENPIKALTILVNRTIFSSYPVMDYGVSHSVEIKDIKEWENRVEGQVSAILSNSEFELSFFDSLYYKNRKSYKKDREYNFVLNGFMYFCGKFDYEKFNTELEDGESAIDKDTVITIPLDDGDIDDYRVVSKIDSVEKFDDVFGKSIYKLMIKLYKDELNELDISVVVSEDNLIDGYIPIKSDLITGAIWLCGMLDMSSDNG
jgi:hypothetical protein